MRAAGSFSRVGRIPIPMIAAGASAGVVLPCWRWLLNHTADWGNRRQRPHQGFGQDAPEPCSSKSPTSTFLPREASFRACSHWPVTTRAT